MSDLRKVSHYGVVKFGDIICEAVVLNDATRGFVQRQFAQMLGYRQKTPGSRWRAFLANFAPKALFEMEKTGYARIQMPHGGQASFIPADVVMEMVDGVIDAALAGTLHHKQQGALTACRAIQKSIARVGLQALIDEATGYQYHRAPDALQELFSRLLRQHSAGWERRFHPDYYKALYRLFGWQYGGHDKNPPNIIGKITLEWVYGPVMPIELIDELRSRKDASDKHHQWLSDQGLRLLEDQIKAVTVIARSSANYRDFRNRCNAAFGGSLQLGLLDELPELS